MNPNRRTLLMRSACGFGALATGAMANSAIADSSIAVQPYHHRPKAKRIIFLFMQGGVSQVDSFDYKPLLEKRHGEELVFDDARQLAKTGKKTSHRLMRSPWKHR